MKLEDINFSERIIRICRGKGKKERHVLFTNSCGEHLKDYLKTRDDDLPYVVFLNRHNATALSPYSIKFWFKAYKVKLGFHVNAHSLRHTFAAHLAIKGMPFACIQALLGHEDPNTTQVYKRFFQKAQKEMYD